MGDIVLLNSDCEGKYTKIMRIDTAQGRRRWEVDGICKVLPGRGRAAVAEVRVLKLRQEDARKISDDDAMAEHFTNPREFLFKWCMFYDQDGFRKLQQDREEIYHPATMLNGRPDELYRCFAIDFELLEVY